MFLLLLLLLQLYSEGEKNCMTEMEGRKGGEWKTLVIRHNMMRI
jgi:hypothetical protein